MKYLFDIKKFNRIQAHAVIENTQSLRLMEKLCMLRDAVLVKVHISRMKIALQTKLFIAHSNEWRPPLPLLTMYQIKPMIWEHEGRIMQGVRVTKGKYFSKQSDNAANKDDLKIVHKDS